MKKLLIPIVVACLSFTAIEAQEAGNNAPQEKVMSKQDKEAAKAKKESELMDAFKTADISATEQQKIRDYMSESMASNKMLKADTSLSEDDMKTKYKEISKDREAKIKALVGDAKYKALKDAQKAQKEAAKM